jgi:guanidinopropionase
MIDDSKLKALREEYQDAKGGEMRDPHFRQVAERLFRDGDRRKWPFADVATLLDAPYRPDAPSLADFGGLQIALIGVPMDLGVTNRAGARLGPRAVRAVERIGPYEHVLKTAPLAEARIADVGDAPMRSRYSLEQCHEDIEAFYGRVVKAGVVPLSVGGDHSISYPILKAVGARRPVGMLHIDAHCDTGGPFEGSKFHHGGPFRQAVLDGVLDPERVIQIGIRGGAEYLWEFSTVSGMTVIHAEELAEMGVVAALDKARQVIGDGPAYLSFDVDSLDPGFAPGTGTPEVGGLTPREALALIRGCYGLNFIGGDVVEVAPQYDATTNTAQCAAQMLFTMSALMAEALRRRG